ncbi:hypothetical protein BHE74_00035758 [Ensete ventricosum]|nr:hypothetical protein BHE74_00035758 [Ensete ventricosum]
MQGPREHPSSPPMKKRIYRLDVSHGTEAGRTWHRHSREVTPAWFCVSSKADLALGYVERKDRDEPADRDLFRAESAAGETEIVSAFGGVTRWSGSSKPFEKI